MTTISRKGKPYTCLTCGGVFYSYKGSKNRIPKYCSRKCFGVSITKVDEPKQCAECSKSFVDKYKQTENRTYCSNRCSSIARGRAMVKEYHGKKFVCLTCSSVFYSKHHSSRDVKYCSRKCSGISQVKDKSVTCAVCHVKFETYKYRTQKYCSMVCMGKANSGENSSAWRGGVSAENEKARKSPEYKMWRKAVFERDRFTCVMCGISGVKLHADHIKPFAYYKDLRYDIDNGRTLCVPCHLSTDTYGSRAINYRNQIGV